MSVFFYGCMTMDGYLADKHHNLDWLYESGSIEETGFDSFYKKMDITIMGKRTFDEIQKIEDFDKIYPTTKNYVFTHTSDLSSEMFQPVSGSIIEFVEQIDKHKNIWIIGGNTVLAPLLDLDLVDCMIIQIAPVLLGAGIPLFSQNEGLRRYYLKEVRKYGQFAELIYSK